MPNLDGTGPQGMGPKTGQSLGKCKDAAKNALRPNRWGFGRGVGHGLGRGGRFSTGQTTNNNEK